MFTVYTIAPKIVHMTESAGNATAVCPSTSTLTSGGFRGTAVTVSAAPGLRRWNVTGSGTIQSYAVCATHNVTAKPAVSATFTTHVAWGPADGASPLCAAGQSATGGGYSLVSGTSIPLPVNTSVQNAPNGWTTTVYDNGYASETVAVWAVCVVFK